MAAVIKKIIAVIVSNPKVLKTIGGIILGILIIICMPIAAVIGIFNGDINIDLDRLSQMIEENMTDEEQEKIQHINDTMSGIESQMIAGGYPQERVQEAQLLYMLTLEEQSTQDGFIETLVGCFEAEQTDEQLVQNVNQAFGLEFSVEEFSEIMNGIRSVTIVTSDYYDKTTKNNLDLVTYVKHAKEAGWGYVWGTYGQILSENGLESLISQYPKDVGEYKDFIKQNWLGKRTTDCGGLIKGYIWLNTTNSQIEYGTNGMPALRADEIYETATEKGTIDTIPEIQGLAVWKQGHIGVYVGNGKVIEAMATTVGVIETNLSDGTWTHWLKVPSVTYIETEE